MEQKEGISQAQAASEALLLDMVAQTRAVGEQEREVRSNFCICAGLASLQAGQGTAWQAAHSAQCHNSSTPTQTEALLSAGYAAAGSSRGTSGQMCACEAVLTFSVAPRPFWVQMEAQEDERRREAAREDTLTGAVEKALGAAEPQMAEAQLGLQRVSPASLAQLVRCSLGLAQL